MYSKCERHFLRANEFLTFKDPLLYTVMNSASPNFDTVNY